MSNLNLFNLEKKPYVIVDEREMRHLKELKNWCETKVMTLVIGDFILSDNTIVERKTRDDFEQSIIDGRLFKQCKIMKEHYKNAVVIVEGQRNQFRVSKKALIGAYSSLVCDYGVSIFFTRDKKSTCELIAGMAKHEQFAKKREVLVFGKRRNKSYDEQREMIISSFPFVGLKSARKLLEKFGSVRKIINAKEEEFLEIKGFGKKKIEILIEIIRGAYKK